VAAELAEAMDQMAGPPPFRADHVGSLLRPPALLDMRRRAERGEASAADLAEAENRAIAEAVALQERVGLKLATDGEFRRRSYHSYFYRQLGDIVPDYIPAEARAADGRGAQPRAVINSKLKWTHPIHVDDYRLLASLTRATPKITIPGPCALHFRGGDDWRGTIDRYIAVTNRVLKGLPETLHVGMHLCRGNRGGQWHSQGSYDAVAEKLFNDLAIPFYFLEYDTPRAGDFTPLRFVPKDKTIVLGLISTKTAEIESKDALRRRIDEASRFVPMERLALSPQCGFASIETGNPVSPQAQEAKLRLAVELADELWTSA
jgi:5-methyltetrahydropteroyltriglutamate--homocysteine methyltransferase